MDCLFYLTLLSFFKFPILVSFLNLHSWDCKIVICVHWWLAVSTIQHPNNVIFLWNRLIGWQRDLNKLKCGDYLCIAKLLQIISHYLYTKPRLITFPFPSRLFPPSPSPSLVLLWCLSVTATFPSLGLCFWLVYVFWCLHQNVNDDILKQLFTYFCAFSTTIMHLPFRIRILCNNSNNLTL